jgi:hypothetical protein
MPLGLGVVLRSGTQRNGGLRRQGPRPSFVTRGLAHDSATAVIGGRDSATVLATPGARSPVGRCTRSSMNDKSNAPWALNNRVTPASRSCASIRQDRRLLWEDQEV